jgi:hypothetical protein
MSLHEKLKSILVESNHLENCQSALRLLNPPVVDAQLVWSFKNDGVGAVIIFSWIWDEKLENNPEFWFATKEDCTKFIEILEQIIAYVR